MREIKFEFAGQQSDGKWILSRPFTLNEIGIGWVHQFVASSNPPVHFDKLIARQFTGLKDKNGKEIYEGDILQISSACLPEFAGQPVAVVFEMGGFRDSYYKWILDGKQYGFAVIGNVYENPEMTRL